MISNIHHNCESKQYCHVGNTVKQCRLGLFQDSAFAGDPEDSKSMSGGTSCVFGSHTFVPISWVWKKQTSVLHSSTKSKIIFWMQDWGWMVFPLFDLRNLIVAVIGNTNQSHKERRVPFKSPTRKNLNWWSKQWWFISSNVHFYR